MNNNAENRCCAYIDILGFKNYVLKDKVGALKLLETYQEQLARYHTLYPKPQPYYAPYPQYSNSSFNYFIPFSDSIFILSNDSSLFTLQLATFIYDSFDFTSYSNIKDPLHPEKVTENKVEYDRKTKSDVNTSQDVNRFPLLFRGGIGFEDCTPVHLDAIQNDVPSRVPSLIGKAVVDAVAFEQMGFKGPRILCNEKFYNELNDQAKKIVFKKFDSNDSALYEIYWPIVNYLIEDNPQKVIDSHFMEIIIPAIKLWKAYNHKPENLHYYNFIKLITKGTLSYYENDKSSLEFIKNRMQEILQTNGMEMKIHDLTE